MDVSMLFDDALAALRSEDSSLRLCFKASDTSVAHGVTYWVFETTLVYFIFKAWLPKVDVVWEHVLDKPNHRASPEIVGRAGAHVRCDLAIRENGEIVAAFEAKWWNDNTRRTWATLVEDANKLRRGFADTVEKYLLTFWWGDSSSWAADVGIAKESCGREVGMSLIKFGKFDTQLVNQKGYFALGLVKIS